MLGIDADPIRSREHILLSAILDAAWGKGESIDLAGLIGRVQKPPFDKLGVFDVESFFPAKERTGLALRNQRAARLAGFRSLARGDPLDMQRLLHIAGGQATDRDHLDRAP